MILKWRLSKIIDESKNNLVMELCDDNFVIIISENFNFQGESLSMKYFFLFFHEMLDRHKIKIDYCILSSKVGGCYRVSKLRGNK